MAQGVISAIWGANPGAREGGVGRHWPGSKPPTNGGCTFENPSWLRHFHMASATAWPHSIPRWIDSLCSAAVLLAIPDSETMRRLSNVAAWAGKSLTRLAYAAWTAAARSDAPGGAACGT